MLNLSAYEADIRLACLIAYRINAELNATFIILYSTSHRFTHPIHAVPACADQRGISPAEQGLGGSGLHRMSIVMDSEILIWVQEPLTP